MSYINPYSTGAEVERALDTGEYSINSHGDIGAHYNSIMNADLPAYTSMFYQPSQHELLLELKYDKVSLDYDRGLRDIRDMVRGPPIEAYIPRSVLVPDGVGANSSVIIRDAEIVPKKNILDEIEKARAEVIGGVDAKSPITIIRTTEIEQEFYIKRRMKLVELFRRK